MLSVRDYLDRRKARGEIFPRNGDEAVPPFQLVEDLVSLGLKDAVVDWLERIEHVSQGARREIFERFPSNWISEAATDFALQVLRETEILMREELESCET